jgi:monothiol glutaredoxin
MSDAAATTTDPVHGFIAKTLGEHSVVLFMKGSPDAPKCGFSSQVVQILDQLGAEYVGVDVLQSQPLRDGIKTYSDWPTIPQLYVKGEFVGGCDIIKEMYETGELESFLDEQGVLADEA